MYTLIRAMLRLAVLLALYSMVVLISAKPWIGFVVAAAAAFHLLKKKKWYTCFGSAKWAEEEDLRKAGMIRGSGLCVGYVQGSKSKVAGVNAIFNPDIPPEEACERFLGSLRRDAPLHPVHLTKAIHTICCAPVGVGKSTAVAIPFLLTCPESCVVVDFKGELAAITSARRRQMGHRVAILDPFKVFSENPDKLNILDFIDKDSPLAIDDCRDAANALVVKTGREDTPHWDDSAQLWIASMMATTAAYGNEAHRSLQDVRVLLTDPKKMQMAIDLMRQSEDPMLVRMGNELTHFVDRELNSVLTTANRHLQFLDTPAIFDSTCTSSFNPSDLLKGKMTIYLILPPDRMRSQTGLLRLWLSSLLRAVVRGGLQ
jgi:type IV secretion system protein VirD4